MPDVVTIGETMIRLTPKGLLRLEQAGELEMAAGGAESNVAVGLARLGLSSGWISKLPDHPLGRFIAGEVGRHRVDVSRVVWAREGRVGLYFFERGLPPRPSRVYYDRKGSAITNLREDEVDWAYVRGAKVVLTTGITLSLSEACLRLVQRAAQEGRQGGARFAFDVNYRVKLWTPAEARRALEGILPSVDILFCGIQDADRVLGIRGAPEEVAAAIKARYGIGLVVLTLGGEGSLALDDGLHRPRRVFTLRSPEPLGAGDAFAAGFLYGYLTEGVQRGLDYGSACAGAKLTIAGDFAIVTREELDELLALPEQDIHR